MLLFFVPFVLRPSGMCVVDGGALLNNVLEKCYHRNVTETPRASRLGLFQELTQKSNFISTS